MRIHLVLPFLLILTACDAPAPAPKPQNVSPAPKPLVSEPVAKKNQPQPKLQPKPQPKPLRPAATAPQKVTKKVHQKGVIPPAWARALKTITPDKRPKNLTSNRHSLVSNEYRMELYRPLLADKGGVFIGIGTDQNYVMAGWQKPSLLILVDFDQMVVDLHGVYGHFFTTASTPEAFFELWQPSSKKRVRELIERRTSDPKTRSRQLRAYQMGRKQILKRLRWQLKSFKKAKVSSFLDDPKQYKLIADLWRQNRVISVRGDLTANRTFKGIGNVLKSLGLSIQTVYLSNAEQYFPYNTNFRRNMMDLPMTPDGLFLRTHHVGKLKYVFLVQTAENFRAWLQTRTKYARHMFPGVQKKHGHTLYRVEKLPRIRTKKATR